MTIIQALKSLDVNREQIDDLLFLHKEAKSLRAEYVESDIDVPEWLSGAIDMLSTEVTRQSRDRLALRLKELDRAEAGLKTATERREDIKSERERLQRRLGQTPTPVGG